MSAYRYAAFATTVPGYGNFDVTIKRTSPLDAQERSLASEDSVEVRSAPQTEGFDADAVLSELGYVRVTEWQPTDFGGVCYAEREE